MDPGQCPEFSIVEYLKYIAKLYENARIFTMNSRLNGQINIYDVVKKEKLDFVNRPINEAHGLPIECYNDI